MSLRAPSCLAAARRPAARALALLGALLAATPAGVCAAAQAWRSPVDGAIAGRFSYSSGAPFARGARRGIDLAAPPGRAVRSACHGIVSWTGRLPGSRARGVTVRCGRLAATHLGLAAVAVRRGEPVSAGTRLGTLGPGGLLRLGARRVGSRFGYVDPAALLAEHPPDVAPPAPGARPRDRPGEVPPPHAPAPGASPAVPRAVPAQAPGLAHASVPAHASPLADLPLLAWAGLALLVAGAAGGAARVSRRPRRRRAVERARPRPLPR